MARLLNLGKWEKRSYTWGMEHASTATELGAGFAVSQHVEALMAAEQVVEQASASVEPGCADLAMIFVSGRHVEELGAIAEYVSETLVPGTVLGVSAEGVIGGAVEIERQTAVSLFVASLPGTRLQSFMYKDLPFVRDGDDEAKSELARAMGVRHDTRAVLFFADPFSVPAAAVVEAMNGVHESIERCKPFPILGGMASSSPAPGGNVLLLNEHVIRAGGIGVSISGNVQIDTLVSQGCRPIGKPMVVTDARRNIIKALGGRRAIDVIHESILGLSAEDRELLPNGVFIGRVINEYKDRFGRGDFLIRGVMGIDQKTGAIAVGDSVKVGQTVQLHLRDSHTASEDLSLLLEIQKIRGPAVGGLLFTCNGRGSRLFSNPSHDARLIADALVTPGGEPMPLAGMFAAGEIGPVGPRSFVHGHTACLAMFRQRKPSVGLD